MPALTDPAEWQPLHARSIHDNRRRRANRRQLKKLKFGGKGTTYHSSSAHIGMHGGLLDWRSLAILWPAARHRMVAVCSITYHSDL